MGRAGVLAGIKSCLLESGAHTLEMADEFPTDLPSYTLQDISGMLPVTTLSLDDFDPDTDLLSRSDLTPPPARTLTTAPPSRSRPDVSEPAPQVPLRSRCPATSSAWRPAIYLSIGRLAVR